MRIMIITMMMLITMIMMIVMMHIVIVITHYLTIRPRFGRSTLHLALGTWYPPRPGPSWWDPVGPSWTAEGRWQSPGYPRHSRNRSSREIRRNPLKPQDVWIGFRWFRVQRTFGKLLYTIVYYSYFTTQWKSPSHNFRYSYSWGT